MKRKLMSVLLCVGLVVSTISPTFADEVVTDEIIAVEDGSEEIDQDIPEIAPAEEVSQLEEPSIEDEEGPAELTEDDIEDGPAQDDPLPEEDFIEEGIEEASYVEEDPTVVGEPDDFTLNYNNHYDTTEPALISVSVETESTDPITYQWSYALASEDDGEVIDGATESSYLATKSGFYFCHVTCGSSTQRAFIEVHIDSGFEVSFEGSPNYFPNPGETQTIKVNAKTNLGNITYKWETPSDTTYKEGTDTYTIDSSSQRGDYSCFVTDGINYDFVYFYVFPVSNTIEDGVPFQTVEPQMYKFTVTRADVYTFDVVDGPLSYIHVYDSDRNIVRYLSVHTDVDDPEYGESTFPATIVLNPGVYYIAVGTYDNSKTTEGIIYGTCKHNWTSTVTKKATCTQTGIKALTCTNCKTTRTEVIPVDSNAHTWDEGKVTKEPTAVAEGEKTYTCKNNATHTKTEKIAKLPATLKLNVSGTVPLKVKQTSKKVLVSDLAAGDSVASVKADKENVVNATVSGNTISLKGGKKPGSATVTVTLKSGKTASFKVKVQKATVKTKKISGLKKSYTLKAKKSLTLVPIITPITTTDKLSFTSSDKKVATVSKKGKVTAKKKGKAYITVKSGKKKFKVTIKVTK